MDLDVKALYMTTPTQQTQQEDKWSDQETIIEMEESVKLPKNPSQSQTKDISA